MVKDCQASFQILDSDSMFTIYLPIAEMPVNMLLLLMLGGMAGVLSGIFGIGGGFLLTPFLIFIGIPPAVAVSTAANQIIAASVSGFLTHWRRANVDIKMGLFLLVGGLIGSSLGVMLFAWLKSVGMIDIVIALSYVLFLGTIGGMMAWESSRVILKKRRGEAIVPQKRDNHFWRFNLPWLVAFPKSQLEISGFLPIAIGVVVGVLVSIMGIGGGFFMIPAMIYVLGMPFNLVVGTSLFQIIFTTTNVTILQAINTQTVDVVLAALLLVGSAIGAQYGTRIGSKLPAEKMRFMLAAMVLAVSFTLAVGLFIKPNALYTIEEIGK